MSAPSFAPDPSLVKVTIWARPPSNTVLWAGSVSATTCPPRTTQRAAGRSVLWFYPQLLPDATAARRVFAGAGSFEAVAWSPDARWLALTWKSADQWLFIRSAAVRKVIPVSGIEEAFGPNARIAGWCCP